MAKKKDGAAVKVAAKLPDDGTGPVDTAATANGTATPPPKSEAPAVATQDPPKMTKGEDGQITLDFSTDKKKKDAEAAAKAAAKAEKEAEKAAKEAEKAAAKPEKKEEAKPAATTKKPASPRSPAILSPFAPPTEKQSRMKIFLWGDTGAGKTSLLLQFPALAVIDMDNGTDPFKHKYKFEVKKTVNIDECRRLVEWLATHAHPYLCLGIDPITILWEALQKKWSDIFLANNKSSKGHKNEYYDMQVKDWQALKADLKSLIRMLMALDMNIIVTARAKPKYKSGSGDFMTVDGETFDGEKSLPYMFDTVLELRNNNGQRMIYCTKDRWEVFPTDKPVPLSYTYIEKVWEKMGLGAPSNQIVLPPEEEVVRDLPQTRHTMMTPEQKDTLRGLAVALEIDKPTFDEALAAREVKTVDDLTTEQAEEMISNLRKLQEARSQIGGE